MAYAPPPLKANSEPLARYNAESAVKPVRTNPQPATRRTETTASLSKPKPEAAQPKAQDPESQDTSSSNSIGETDILEDSEAAEGSASLAQEPSASSSACSEASGEAQAAQAATETSQKLYHLRRAQRLCPNNGTFHADLGKVYLSMGRPSDARNEFNNALKLDPNLKAARDGLEEVKSAGPEKF